MRVGVYLGNFMPDVGGGFTFQDDVLRALIARAGNRPDEFVILAENPAASDLLSTLNPSGNVRTVVLPRQRCISRWLDGAKMYSSLLGRVFRGPGRIGAAAARLGLDCVWYVAGGCYEAVDVPYIATVWDLTHRLQPWFPEVSANGIWESRELAHRTYLQRASFVIVGTDAGRDELQLFYQVPSIRIRKLPHPTPAFALMQPLSDTTAAKAKYDLRREFILYPAQFWPHKNHATLLDALRCLWQDHRLRPDLVLVGSDKGNEDYIRSLVHALDAEDRVHFLGFVPHADLISLYRCACAMVYPSMCGPENLPPLEAFGLGCPVVAADIPGAAEQLGDAAVLFDPTSPADMASKIARVLADGELRSTLISRGRARAARWTSTEFVGGVFELFDEFSRFRRAWRGS